MIPRKMGAICIIISAVQFGCTGQIYTVTGATPDDRGREGKYLKGITAYPPQLYKEIYHLTFYVVDGKILRKASAEKPDQRCTPDIKENIVIRPNYFEPYQLVYEQGVLESKEIGVALKDGMVTSVNVKGTPDRGETAKNILSPITELASSAMGFAASDEILCNAHPVFTGIEKYAPEGAKAR